MKDVSNWRSQVSQRETKPGLSEEGAFKPSPGRREPAGLQGLESVLANKQRVNSGSEGDSQECASAHLGWSYAPGKLTSRKKRLAASGSPEQAREDKGWRIGVLMAGG